MPENRVQERKCWKNIFGIGGSEHIESIAKIIAVLVEIPANVTVRLTINAVAIMDSLLEAIASMFFRSCAAV